MKPLHVNSWDAYERAMNEAKIKVALDIGANEGGYIKTLVEHGFEVYAFEPVPQMFRKLSNRFDGNGKVVCFNCGAGDARHVVKSVQVLEAWTIAAAGTGGLQPTPNDQVPGIFDMQIVTIDEMIFPAPVGIIKIDTDGYEYRVLKGGERTIRRWRPPILCELGCYLAKLGDDPRQFIEFIFSMGYEIWSMDGLNKFTTWAEVEPQYPHHTTHDVMLLPR